VFNAMSAADHVSVERPVLNIIIERPRLFFAGNDAVAARHKITFADKHYLCRRHPVIPRDFSRVTF